MSSDTEIDKSRRGALKCLAFGGAGTLFMLSGGVLAPIDLALAASSKAAGSVTGTPLFLQISDTHIGFNKEANPDVAGTLKQTIDLVNAMPVKPALAIHTGDITHLSKPAEFDTASQLMSGLNITELHTVPGEHNVTDGLGTEYFNRFGQSPQRPGRSTNQKPHQRHRGVLVVCQAHPMQLSRRIPVPLPDVSQRDRVPIQSP